MIFNNNKVYYKEKKASERINRKLEKDILNKNIKTFSYEDIAKPTHFARKANNKSDQKKKKVIPTYNTTGESKSILTTYGTYYNPSKDPNRSSKNTNIKGTWNTKNKVVKKTKSYKTFKTFKAPTTIDEYITKQHMIKKELERQKKMSKNKSDLKAKQSHQKKGIRNIMANIKNKNRRDTSINNKRANKNVDDTIDLLLKKIPTEDT